MFELKPETATKSYRKDRKDLRKVRNVANQVYIIKMERSRSFKN
jgi:hypothetical protein